MSDTSTPPVPHPFGPSRGGPGYRSVSGLWSAADLVVQLPPCPFL
jgi:hypothetical protein